jgi:hypothetical protein
MFKPYTYYLYHIPTGKKYYGVRLSPKAEPEQDLWVHYFSSSDKVHLLLEQYGDTSFKIEIRKVFETPQEAHEWEQKVLRRTKAVEREDWLNQALSTGPFYRQGPHKEKSKTLMSEKALGENNPFFGKTHTKEWCTQHSKDVSGKNHPLYGKKHRSESISKNRESNKRNAEKIDYINGMQGKHHKKESIEKMREAKLKQTASLDYVNPMAGKNVPEKTRRKISIARKEWFRKQRELSHII